MSRLRKDPVSGRWVIINDDAPKLDFVCAPLKKSSKVCPFCPGNESLTPPTIIAYGKKGRTQGHDWLVRVVSNKFPALRIEGSHEKTKLGMYERIGGFGAHEVIVESPDHNLEIPDMPLEQVERILRCFRDRCLDLRQDPRIKYILIFKNYGQAAGASIEHPHSQLIGLPISPSRVTGEIKGSERHFELSEHCLFCDILKQDIREQQRLVIDDHGFVALAPFAARFPFETWILPKEHKASFDQISEEDISGLAKTLQSTLAKLKSCLGDPPYNLMIHTLPLQTGGEESFHWHIEIIPHLTQVAGFEMGTGFYVNPTPPEAAAARMRQAR
jgi:UDPglucose--hexose-1-phosphate uridylyltransferase